MKKYLFYVICLVVTSVAFTSCEGLFGNCKICSLNTYEDGNLINTQSEAEYCDADLISIQAIAPVSSGNTVTRWECK